VLTSPLEQRTIPLEQYAPEELDELDEDEELDELLLEEELEEDEEELLDEEDSPLELLLDEEEEDDELDEELLELELEDEEIQENSDSSQLPPAGWSQQAGRELSSPQ